MVRPAAGSHHSRVLDFYQGLLVPKKLVPLPMEQPSERRQLHVFLLESAVGKDERHGDGSLVWPVVSKPRQNGFLRQAGGLPPRYRGLRGEPRRATR